MCQSQDRMTDGHPRSRISHDHPDPLAHDGSIAVHCATGARRLALGKATASQPLIGIREQRLTVCAQALPGSSSDVTGLGRRHKRSRTPAMMVAAVQGDHHRDRPLFTAEPAHSPRSLTRPTARAATSPPRGNSAGGADRGHAHGARPGAGRYRSPRAPRSHTRDVRGQAPS